MPFDAVSTAKANVGRAKEAVQKKDFQKAIDAYDQAIEACVDYSPAIDGRRNVRFTVIKSKLLKAGLELPGAA